MFVRIRIKIFLILAYNTKPNRQTKKCANAHFFCRKISVFLKQRRWKVVQIQSLSEEAGLSTLRYVMPNERSRCAAIRRRYARALRSAKATAPNNPASFFSSAALTFTFAFTLEPKTQVFTLRETFLMK